MIPQCVENKESRHPIPAHVTLFGGAAANSKTRLVGAPPPKIERHQKSLFLNLYDGTLNLIDRKALISWISTS